MTLSVTLPDVAIEGGRRTVPGSPGMRSARQSTAREGTAVAEVLVVRPVGAHREPGSNPWRTGLREIVDLLTFGLVRLWTPPH